MVVLSLPNGVASQIVPTLLERDVRIVDLSADYRYRSLDEWKGVYVQEARLSKRQDYMLCQTAVYGLPEWKSLEISMAKLVAGPGCIPTASLLPLLPFLSQGLIDQTTQESATEKLMKLKKFRQELLLKLESILDLIKTNI